MGERRMTYLECAVYSVPPVRAGEMGACLPEKGEVMNSQEKGLLVWCLRNLSTLHEAGQGLVGRF